MSGDDSGHRWIDAGAAARSLDVVKVTLLRWCRAGHVRIWRTVGLSRRVQIRDDALAELRREMLREGNNRNNRDANG